ncbi:MAG TPA: hypothetical protein VFI88_03330 [Sphingomicrobium sp.]|nr:hypothetical protein [Sphingomicrobium sp.]
MPAFRPLNEEPRYRHRDLRRILGSADLALGLAWDLSLYLDAVAVATVVAVARHARIAVRLLRARFDVTAAVVVRRRKRERRRRRERPLAPARSDEHPAPAWAFAA